MADPALPFQPFQGAAGDAAVIRRRAAQVRGFLVRDLGVPEEDIDRELRALDKITGSSEEAAEYTAIGAAIARTVPGRVGAALASLAVGLEKSPDTGKLKPGSTFASNLAPSPVGFGQPSAFNLPKDWWIPEGATDFVPRPVDPLLKLGLPEARAKDERNQRIAEDAALREEMKRLSTFTTASLEKLSVAPDPPFGAFFVRQMFNQPKRDPDKVRLAAKFVLAQRAEAQRLAVVAAPAAAQVGPGLSPETIAAISELDRLLAANPPDP